MKELSEKDIEDYKIYIKNHPSDNDWDPYTFLISRFYDMSLDEVNNLYSSDVSGLLKEIVVWVNNNYKDGKRRIKFKPINRWELLDLD